MAHRSIPLRVLALALLVALWGCERQATPGPTGSTRSPASPPATPRAEATSPALPEDQPEGLRVAAGVHFIEVLTAGAQATEPLPLVVSIHGLGDRPERFAWLLGRLPVKARVVVPRGLDEYHGGYSWFPIRVWDPDPERLAQGIQKASDALARAIEVLQRRHPTRGKAVVTGFSQGGMLSFALALHHPELVQAAFPIAGWLPPKLVPTTGPAADAPPIVAFHGVDDDLLPIGPTRKVVGALDELGYDIEFREFDRVAHAVAPDIRKELVQRLTRELRKLGSAAEAGIPSTDGSVRSAPAAASSTR